MVLLLLNKIDVLSPKMFLRYLQFSSYCYRILNFSLPILRKQYIALKGMQLANGVIEDDFTELKQLIRREKAVIWADQIVEEESDQNDQLKMSAVMSFPQLVSYQNTPCSK